MQAKDAGTLTVIPPEGSTGSSPGTARRRAAFPLPGKDLARTPGSRRLRPTAGRAGGKCRRSSIGKTRSGARMSPSPSWPKPAAPREIPTSKSRLPAPGCCGPPTALPTCNPPGEGGITVQTGCVARQSSLPSTTCRSTGSRGAWQGAGRALGGQDAGEHPRTWPGSGLRPGTTRCTVGAHQTDRGGKSRPACAGPPTAPAAFPLPAHGRVHRRSDRDTGERKKAPEGNGESEKKPAGGEQEGPWPPPPRHGVQRGGWGSPPHRGAWPLPLAPGCSAGSTPLGETEARRRAGSSSARRGPLGAPHPPSRGGKRSPPAAAWDDTSSPASSRSTLFLQEPRSPDSGQAASASLLPAPPALPPLPAPRAPGANSGPRHPHPQLSLRRPPSPGAHLPVACQGDLGAVPRPVRAKFPGARRRCQRQSWGGRMGWAGGIFFPPLFIYSLGGVFFSLPETKAACAVSRGVRRVPAVPGPGGDAGPAAPGALGGRFPPHTDGCFDSVERLT